MNTAGRKRLAATTFALLGFENHHSEDKRALQAGQVIADSISANLISNGLRASDGVADIYIMPQSKATAMAQNGPRSQLEEGALKKPTIVLCQSIVSSREFSVPEMGFIATVTPPFGPRKLLQALATCLENMAPSQHTHSKHDSLSVRSRVFPGAKPTDLSRENGSSNGSDAQLSGHDPDNGGIALRSTPNPKETKETAMVNGVTPEKHPRLTILIVDDNNMNLSLLRAFTKKAGHHHVSATNGQEAVDAYRHAYDRSLNHNVSPPTVVLMDITMPIMDGLEATRHIRAIERTRGITPAMIIALTAADSPEARHEAFSSGLDLFLTKPVRMKELASILDEHTKSNGFK